MNQGINMSYLTSRVLQLIRRPPRSDPHDKSFLDTDRAKCITSEVSINELYATCRGWKSDNVQYERETV